MIEDHVRMPRAHAVREQHFTALQQARALQSGNDFLLQLLPGIRRSADMRDLAQERTLARRRVRRRVVRHVRHAVRGSLLVVGQIDPRKIRMLRALQGDQDAGDRVV